MYKIICDRYKFMEGYYIGVLFFGFQKHPILDI